MITIKTPLRIPFTGGLTDLPFYADEYRGCTISCTIDKYITLTLEKQEKNTCIIEYLDCKEEVQESAEIRHTILRETIQYFGIDFLKGHILHIKTDLPGYSGLGFSGALTVSIVALFHYLKYKNSNHNRILQDTFKVQKHINDYSGYQDPAVCLKGGLLFTEYGVDSATCNRIEETTVLTKMNSSLHMYYTGHHNPSFPSLKKLTECREEALPILHNIKANAIESYDAINNQDMRTFARLFHKQQLLKQTLPGNFTNNNVNAILKLASNCNLYGQFPGGKVGAYFIAFYFENSTAPRLELEKPLQEIPFSLISKGLEVSDTSEH
jgi:D-glycero-alpha-D-manno-heptose-7-phosphate kinase